MPRGLLYRPVTPKSVPPKSVRPDRFWQKKCQKWSPRTTFAAKISPAGPILAAKIGPPCQFRSPRGTDFGKKLSAKISPPSLLFPILHYRAIPLGTCIGSYSYS